MIVLLNSLKWGECSPLE